MTFCENADGANNNAGLAQITRVPTLADAVVAMQTPLNMGIGGTLDCGSGQPFPPDGVVTEIWVPRGLLRRMGNLRVRPDPRTAACRPR